MHFRKTDFNDNIEPFLNYRERIGYATKETVRSDRIDLNLFGRFIEDKNLYNINGKSVIDFQQYLVNERNNSPASANRKIFTLRAYQNFLVLNEVSQAQNLPFKNVLKIRNARPLRPNFLSENEIKELFDPININSILGLRDYAIYALMYLLGLRVGEVHRLNTDDIDWQNDTITIHGKRN